ncbi:uncharacterized protein LOC135688869 isoform X2 [Rhopilema esculentum]|uniref:uncharacterized protein LOC135688869 isoform X2 n=1 Tax=Rhopilema esculentum TaxID=499914 RepID=UPI0031D4EB03
MMLTKQKEVMSLVNNIAMDATENKFGFQLDRNNVKYPKLKYKGKIEKTLLRNSDPNNPDKKLDDHISKFVKFPEGKVPDMSENGCKEYLVENNAKSDILSEKSDDSAGKTTPEYKILHRGHFDMQNFTLSGDAVISTRPAELCVEIQLPTMRSAAGVNLDVFKRRLTLESEKPKYHLSIPLPYPVDEDNGKAQFDKSRKVLIVTLPVIKQDLNQPIVQNENKETVKTGTILSKEISANYLEREAENPPANAGQVFGIKHNVDEGSFVDKEACVAETERVFEHCSEMECLVREPSDNFDNEVNEKIEGRCTGIMGASTLSKRENNNMSMEIARDKDISNRKEGIKPAVINDHIRSTEQEEYLFHKSKTSSNQVSAKSDCEVVIKRNASCADTQETDNSGKDYYVIEEDAVQSLEVKEDDSSLQRVEDSNQSRKLLKEARAEASKAVYETTGSCGNAVMTEQNGCECDGDNENLMKYNMSLRSSLEPGDVCSPNSNGEHQISAKDNVDCEKVDSEPAGKLIVKEDLENEITTSLDDMEFEFSEIMDLTGRTKLPPYDYDQNEETVTVNIHLSNVRIEDVSLGFGSRKAYFSMKADDADNDTLRWCLLLKFPEYYNLDQDLCSVDVEPECLVITLQKSQDSIGLWNKLYVGTNEKELKEMYFMTDHGMSEILGKMHQSKNLWAAGSAENQTLKPDQTLQADNTSSKFLEAKLAQLLLDQDREDLVDQDTDEERVTGDKTELCKLKEEASTVDSSGSVEDTGMIGLYKTNIQRHSISSQADRNSSSSEMTLDVNLEELQDDVISDTDSSGAAQGLSRHPIERSRSDETNDSSNSRLRSILKRSTSESAETVKKSDGSDENDHAMPFNRSASRNRSKSLNVDYRSDYRNARSRVRNKSVSFDPEPKVCEFVEYSKKQLKKMRKQERKQTEIAAKKMEAASKKSHGKHKGSKSGKNMNFFNGFRKDSGKIRETESETEKESEVSNDVTPKEIPNGDSVHDPATNNSTAKLNRKPKKKKKAERKDERTQKEEERTCSPSEQLTNSLIFELDE